MITIIDFIKDIVLSKEDGNTAKRTLFGSVLRQAIVLVGLVFAYVSAVLYLATLVEPLDLLRTKLILALGTEIGLAIFWLALFGPIFVILFQAIPLALYVKKLERAKARSFKTPPKPPKSAFQLAPRGAIDREEYSRPDGQEKKVLNWLSNTPGSVFYFTGESGVGKSSLVSAYLIPELNDDGWAVVEGRAYGDAVSQIADVLKGRDDLVPQKPSGDPSLRELLGSIGDQRIKENLGPFLLVIDQFEELLMLEDPKLLLQFSEIIKDLAENDLPGVKLLLVYRSEYESEIFKLNFPTPISGTNSLRLGRYNRAHAEQFLLDGGRLPADDTKEGLFRGLDRIEQTRGLYRLITLNMVGLFLEDMGDQLIGDPEQLIQSYIDRCIMEDDDNSIAARKRILDTLVSDAGTKRPQTETKVIEAAVQAPHMTVLMLHRLAEKGLVRSVKRTESTWEISHDFLAGLIGRAIGRLRPTFWSRAKRSFGPLAVLGWVAVFSIGLPFWQQSVEKELRRDIIESAGGKFNPTDSDTYEVVFDSGKVENCEDSREWSDVGAAFASFPQTRVINFGSVDSSTITESHCPVNWFYHFLLAFPPDVGVGLTKLFFPSNVRIPFFEGLQLPNGLIELSLEDATIISFEGLQLPNGLIELSLEGATIISFEGLQLPNGLIELSLEGATIISFEGLQLPAGLTSLDLGGTKISSHENLKLPEGLTSLKLRDATITSFEGLRLLAGLTSLDLIGATITSFEGLQLLEGLTSLKLRDATITSFEGLRLPAGLTSLDLRGATITSFEGLQLPAGLTSLDLKGATITSFERLQLPAGLTSVNLSHATFSSFEGFQLPAGLTSLDLGETKTSSFKGLRLPAGLTSLDLGGTKISSFKVLQLPKWLTKLNLSRATISSFEGLQLPAGLTKLNLSRATIYSFEGLRLPAGLTSLDLRGATIISFEGLQLPAGLAELSLEDATIISFKGFQLPAGLTSLDLGGTKISSFKGLELPEGLIELSLEDATIISFKGFQLPAGLTSLDLEGTKISSFKGLELPEGLTKLSLEGNKIPSLNLLSELTKLTHLNLSGTGISSLDDFPSVESLKNLNISYTSISDLIELSRALPSPEKVQILDISGTKIISLDGIEDFPNLERLSLENTSVSDLERLKGRNPMPEIIGVSQGYLEKL